jgi:hypothetical protein
MWDFRALSKDCIVTARTADELSGPVVCLSGLFEETVPEGQGGRERN